MAWIKWQLNVNSIYVALWLSTCVVVVERVPVAWVSCGIELVLRHFFLLIVVTISSSPDDTDDNGDSGNTGNGDNTGDPSISQSANTATNSQATIPAGTISQGTESQGIITEANAPSQTTSGEQISPGVTNPGVQNTGATDSVTSDGSTMTTASSTTKEPVIIDVTMLTAPEPALRTQGSSTTESTNLENTEKPEDEATESPEDSRKGKCLQIVSHSHLIPLVNVPRSRIRVWIFK